MEAISRAQMQAIEIIWTGNVYKVGDFIRKMWPDKVKPRDKISGGFVLSAVVLLRRLERAGLIQRLGDSYVLTDDGRKAFWQEQQKRLENQ